MTRRICIRPLQQDFQRISMTNQQETIQIQIPQKWPQFFLAQSFPSTSQCIGNTGPHPTSRSETNKILVQEAAPASQIVNPKLTNPLWNYFDKHNTTEFKCKTCGKILKVGTSGTTSSLLKHLKRHKPIHDNYMSEKMKYQEQSKKTFQIPTSEQRSSSQQKVSEMLSVVKWHLDGKYQKKSTVWCQNSLFKDYMFHCSKTTFYC